MRERFGGGLNAGGSTFQVLLLGRDFGQLSSKRAVAAIRPEV